MCSSRKAQHADILMTELVTKEQEKKRDKERRKRLLVRMVQPGWSRLVKME